MAFAVVRYDVKALDIVVDKSDTFELVIVELVVK